MILSGQRRLSCYIVLKNDNLTILLTRRRRDAKKNKFKIMKKNILNILAVHILLIGISCFACNADELQDQALSLFGETRNASVFYLDTFLGLPQIDNAIKSIDKNH